MSKNQGVPKNDHDAVVKKHFEERFENMHPCQKEHRMSLTCLEAQYYDRTKCEIFFTNYKNCKAFWNYVRKDRKGKGIKPNIPLPKDREEIKKEYLPTFKP